MSPGEHVMLAVSDTGHGMDAATQARIFEPFFTTKGVGKGTGLGLSTVFGIVKNSGGTVWVYSEPNVGTTFKVFLPCAPDATRKESTSLKVMPYAGTETVAVVEDDPQLRAVVTGVLRRHGYRIMPFGDPESALQLSDAALATVDLLVTDVIMPHMNGPELVRKLRERRPDLRVLCMSGYTDHSVLQHGSFGDNMPFVQKPITPEVLLRHVREILDR